jgi:hypothetical protein
MTTARDKLLAKMRALMARTVANGCTAAEAMAALDMLQRMKDEHDVDDVDLQLGDDPVITEQRQADDRDRIRESLVMAVGAFCQCRAWSTRHHREQLTFCGLQSEVIFAHWLLDTLADFVKRSLTDFLEATRTPEMPRIRRRDTEAFVVGCTTRLCSRLYQLAERAKPAAGRGLVLARNALIERHLAERGIALHQHRDRAGRSSDAGIWNAGAAAGDEARFDRPIERTAAPSAITSTRGKS